MTKHVQPSGSDSGTTGPFRTIGYGLTQILGSDSLEIHAGVYAENLTAAPSGSARAYTRIVAAPGEVVRIAPTTPSPGGAVIWLDGPYHHISVEGLIIDGTAAPQNCVWTSTNNGHDVHHIRFLRCEMIAGVIKNGTVISLGAHALIHATGSNEVLSCTLHGGGVAGNCGYECASYGVYVQGPRNIINGCDIYDTCGAFLHLYGGGGDQPDETIITNNRLHHLTRAGAPTQVWGILAYGTGNLIANNLIYGIDVGDVTVGNAAITLAGSGAKVWHNTIANNRNTGILVGAGVSDTDVRGNIAWQSSGADYVDQGFGTVATANLFGVNPLVVNAAAGDFHLTAESPAIGGAARVTPRDYYGVFRTNPTAIGAAEFGGTSPAPPDPGPTPSPAGAWTITGTLTADLVAAPKP